MPRVNPGVDPAAAGGGAPIPPRIPPRPTAIGSTLFAAQALRYLARSPIIVQGPSTGVQYRFSAAQPVQRVARADCEALLRSGHFARQP